MTEPRSKPILFSGPMINALLNGSKTQTRRVLKPQPPSTHRVWNSHGDDELVFFTDHPTQGEKGNVLYWRCPYGSPGDRLWCRETWAPISPDENWRPIKECNIEYRADTPHAKYPGEWPEEEAKGNDEAPKWRPSIHMPRWASRITLEVVSVRVEQVQDISHEDAMAEGIEVVIQDQSPETRDYSRKDEWFQGWGSDESLGYTNYVPMERLAIESYRTLWDSINGKKAGYSWADNPWVWCVAFRRLTP